MDKKISLERQLTRLSLVSSLPILAALLVFLIYAKFALGLIMVVALLGGMLVIFVNYCIYRKAVYQFRRLSNLLDALVQGDYSLRAHVDDSYGALGGLAMSINGLAQYLSEQRWDSAESQRLTKIVIDHIEVAILALNKNNQIRFFNPAAKKLLLLDQANLTEKLLGQLACVHESGSGSHQVIELSLGQQQGRFNVHVEEFRDGGVQHKLLFITDVRMLLRGEERKAWQSLVRVISHEINNSLSPIISVSQTLQYLIGRPDEEANKNLHEGLTVIAERAAGLGSFVDSYKQLARLADPRKQRVSILNLIEKICLLFNAQKISRSKDDIHLWIDPVQFEQALINLIKNSVEAIAQQNPAGCINIEWHLTEFLFTLMIKDEGGGISNPENVFVPFYSTKKQGSGIGLVLCRQIVEAHGGYLSIVNRADLAGCCATIEIPLESGDA